MPINAVNICQKVVSPLLEFDDHNTFLYEARHELLGPFSLRHIDCVRNKGQRSRTVIHESVAQRGTQGLSLLPPHVSDENHDHLLLEPPCSFAQLSLESHITLFDDSADSDMLAPVSGQFFNFELIKLLTNLLIANVLNDDLLLESDLSKFQRCIHLLVSSSLHLKLPCLGQVRFLDGLSRRIFVV